MNSAQMKKLEQLFASDPCVGGNVLQCRDSKAILALEEMGYARRGEVKLHSPFGTIVCKGWHLTLAGHMAYCFQCAENEEAA